MLGEVLAHDSKTELTNPIDEYSKHFSVFGFNSSNVHWCAWRETQTM